MRAATPTLVPVAWRDSGCICGIADGGRHVADLVGEYGGLIEGVSFGRVFRNACAQPSQRLSVR